MFHLIPSADTLWPCKVVRSCSCRPPLWKGIYSTFSPPMSCPGSPVLQPHQAHVSAAYQKRQNHPQNFKQRTFNGEKKSPGEGRAQKPHRGCENNLKPNHNRQKSFPSSPYMPWKNTHTQYRHALCPTATPLPNSYVPIILTFTLAALFLKFSFPL